LAQAAERPRYGGTLIVPTFSTPRVIDPLAARSPEELAIVGALFETLYAFGPNGSPEPRLALSPPEKTDEPNTLRITLQAELRFHDGSTLGADEVAASLSRLLSAKSSPAVWLLADVEGAKDLASGKAKTLKGATVLSASEFSLRFASPITPGELMERLASPWAAIVKTTPDGPLGAGPFQRDPKDKGHKDELRLLPFAEHAQGRPFLDALTFRRYTLLDAQAAFSAEKLALLPCAPLSPSKKARRLTGPAVLTDALLLSDDATRYTGSAAFHHAVAASIDKSVALPFGLQDLLSSGTAAKLFLPKELYKKTAAKLSGYDAAKAKRELGTAAASFSAPSELTILYDESQLGHRGLAEQVREFFADVDAPPAREIALDAASLASKRSSGDFALVVLTLAPVAREGLALAALRALSGDSKAAFDLIAKGNHRGAKARKQEEAIATAGKLLPLGHRAPEVLYAPNLRGLSFSALGILSFASVWLEE
jgi:MarR-like DNA-binding transcriptional regulator SgrR of sgrS sRNA